MVLCIAREMAWTGDWNQEPEAWGQNLAGAQKQEPRKISKTGTRNRVTATESRKPSTCHDVLSCL